MRQTFSKTCTKVHGVPQIRAWSSQDMELITVWFKGLFTVLLLTKLTSARRCLCVHQGFVLPVDQHPEVTELNGGTCAEIVKEHVHFREADWTLVMLIGHHAFVEEIRTEYDKVECDENNIPITTTVATTTQSTLPTTLPTTKPTTISPTNGTIPVSKPYCPPLTGTHQTNNFNCPQILYVTRSEWGASSTYGALNDLTQQYSCSKDFIVVHQTLGQKCSNPVDCVERLKTDIQNWKSRQFNFAIGDDGTIFELNGFTSIAKHANFFDRISLGIAFIGEYSSSPPSTAALNAFQQFLSCAIDQKLVASSYILRTERDMLGHGLGDALYSSISQLSHY